MTNRWGYVISHLEMEEGDARLPVSERSWAGRRSGPGGIAGRTEENRGNGDWACRELEWATEGRSRPARRSETRHGCGGAGQQADSRKGRKGNSFSFSNFPKQFQNANSNQFDV